MKKEEIARIVRSLLIQHFDIQPEDFSWEIPLEELQQNFNILSYLLYLEQLLQEQFGTGFRILEHISAAIHTPEDVVSLISKEL
ncbi:MAG: hypothetical protein R3B93_15750 [Bacteroidia bacterium]